LVLTTKRRSNIWFFSTTPNRGGGIRYDGTWTSYETGESKPVIWSKDLFRFANDILEEFSIGERDVEINEKYRSLGWDGCFGKTTNGVGRVEGEDVILLPDIFISRRCCAELNRRF